MMKGWIWIGVFLLCVSAGGSLAQDKRVERLTFDYLEVAFWNVSEHQKERLMKWTKETVSYRIIGEMPWMREKEWRKYLDEVSALTGLTFIQTDSDNYDILMFFGMLDQYEKVAGLSIPLEIAQGFGNWSNRTRNKDYGLTRASFCIDPASIHFSDFGIYRIKRLFLGALGILGDVSDVNSLFYVTYNGNTSRLSRSDKRLVKLHYMDFIPTGIDVRELRKIIFRNEEVAELAYEKL